MADAKGKEKLFIRKKKPGRAALERAEQKKKDADAKAAAKAARIEAEAKAKGMTVAEYMESTAAAAAAAGGSSSGGSGTPSSRGDSVTSSLGGSSSSSSGYGTGSTSMFGTGSAGLVSPTAASGGPSNASNSVHSTGGGTGTTGSSSTTEKGTSSGSSSSSGTLHPPARKPTPAEDKKSKDGDIMEEPEVGKRIGDYQLMEMLGKGGFGAVYRGLNIVTGSTVAIKRIGLHGIPKEELESIEMEIKLLQNLDHPNIVKYVDATRTEAHLNIILEFVENGSLSYLLSKFSGGCFPETLVSHYTMQVLRGLHYLHKQGVIHRDIKGANILSTKDGLVKLADFGVATKLNESRKSDSVVGTPYWMAPEIIEMTGQQSSACDIWSVGCTVIELLTGKPPYWDLQQMPALFRIVQDEHPPLPDSISSALQDFLMQCFQKDPNRRIDAKGLMKHYWLKQAHDEEEKKKKHAEQNSYKPGSGAGKAGGKPGTAPAAGELKKPAAAPSADPEDEDWDEPEEKPAKPAAPAPARAGSGSAGPEKGSVKGLSGGGSGSLPSDKSDSGKGKSQNGNDTSFMSRVNSQKLSAATAGASPAKGTPVTPSKPAVAAGPPKLVKAESDLSDAGPLKIHHAVDAGDDPFAEMGDDDPEPISKPVQSTKSPAQPMTRPASASSAMAAAVTGTPLPNTAVASGGASAAADAASPGAAKPLHSFAEGDDDDGFEIDESDLDPARLAETKKKQAAESNDPFSKPPAKGDSMHSSGKPLSLANGGGASSTGTGTSDGFGGGAGPDDDPFADIPFEEADSGAAAADKELVKLTKEFNTSVISRFSPKLGEDAILAACDKLDAMFTANPEPIRNLMTSNGVIPVMEMMESKNKKILQAILRVVNKIIGKNQKFQQNMSLVGLIPAIINLAGPHFSMSIRLEAANFVRQFCYASEFTRKMFIACGGLPVLVGFLEEDYTKSQILVFNAIDCIRHVFEITSNPKNDFCRLFCKFGLLPPLAATLVRVNRDANEAALIAARTPGGAAAAAQAAAAGSDAAAYLVKIAKILHLFSQADSVVKHSFARREVLESIIAALPTLPHECLLLVLKSIRQIAMDSGTLDLLEAAGAIPALMPYFNSPQPEVQNQVLLSMYYLCQLTPSRQEQAAVCGIIPHLQKIIRANHPLKQFAFPIIFLLGRTNKRTRMELKKYSGVEFYLDLLRDVYWRSPALEVCSKWLGEDRQRVEFILNANIGKLFTVFKATKEAMQFQNLLISFHRILKASVRVNLSFGRSALFLGELKTRFEKHSGDNNIRINLIKILNLIYDSHTEPVKLIREHDFLDLLQRLSTDATFHLGVPLAKELLKKYNHAVSGGTSATAPASQPPPPFLVSASSPNLFANKAQHTGSRLL